MRVLIGVDTALVRVNMASSQYQSVLDARRQFGCVRLDNTVSYAGDCKLSSKMCSVLWVLMLPVCRLCVVAVPPIVYGFGGDDDATPLKETVDLLDKLVKEYVAGMVSDGISVVDGRGV